VVKKFIMIFISTTRRLQGAEGEFVEEIGLSLVPENQ
jgi:hypothetical protein